MDNFIYADIYFKVHSDNHYTIRASILTRHHNIFKLGNIETIMLHGVGFEPTHFTYQVLSLAP